MNYSLIQLQVLLSNLPSAKMKLQLCQVHFHQTHCHHLLSDMGPTLSGADCGFQWSHVQRLRRAHPVPRAHPAPHCASISH